MVVSGARGECLTEASTGMRTARTGERGEHLGSPDSDGCMLRSVRGHQQGGEQCFPTCHVQCRCWAVWQAAGPTVPKAGPPNERNRCCGAKGSAGDLHD